MKRSYFPLKGHYKGGGGCTVWHPRELLERALCYHSHSSFEGFHER